MNRGSDKAELSFRSRSILYAVVSEYIATGEPVGSRTLSKRYGIQLSPASIRNVLADLEEAGYLTQPHPSAGRVPTDAGFRFFVDALVSMREIAQEDREAILARMRSFKPGQDDFLRETGRLLSTLTGAVAVISAPRPEAEPLTHLHFVPLRAGTYLALLVSRSGAVQNRVVDFHDAISGTELERVHNYLSEIVQGRSLSEVRELLAREITDARDQYEKLRSRAKDLVEATVSGAKHETHIVVEGQGRMLEWPETADMDKVRGYIRAFEEKGRLLELLDRTLSSGGVQVLIGAETNLSEVQDISMVAAHYGAQGQSPGALGVIGPTRLDYAKVVPIVRFTAKIFGETLEARREEDAED